MEAVLRLRALGHYNYYCVGLNCGIGFVPARSIRLRPPRHVGIASLAVATSENGNGVAVGPVGSGVEVELAKRMLHVVLVSPMEVCATRCRCFLGRAGSKRRSNQAVQEIEFLMTTTFISSSFAS